MGLLVKAKKRISNYKQNKIDEKKYKDDINNYISLCDSDEKFLYNKEYEIPIINEYRNSAANLDVHYFLQDIWMAKKIILNEPIIHYDIGSRVDGFLAHLLSAGLKINMIDIRPLDIEVEGLSFTHGDATNLCNIDDNSINSLSSLHVIEHFGLGRYGDKIDPKGWIKGLKAMQRIVSKGGLFYLGIPIGNNNRLCFNAHRVFDYREVVDILDEMDLVEFAYISDYKINEVPKEEFQNISITNDYGCGLYIFKKFK